jgi:cytochrome c oxidase assembly factor CtaG
MRLSIALVLALAPVATAPAHGGAGAPHELLVLDPLVLGVMSLAALAYGAGVRRLWRVRTGHGVRPSQVASFATGMALLALALIWPLDAAADRSFAAHMAQHLLLIALAPPLLVLGAPLAPLAAFAPVRRALVAIPGARLAHPLAVFGAHGVVVWTWHAPALFQAALRSPTVHALEHATMLAAALLFWWMLLPAGRAHAPTRGAGLLFLFLTMTHMGLLGALLTFAPRTLYPAYGDRPPAFGLTPLEDQQLAGLIMWVPGGMIYLAAALALAAAWLRDAERPGWAPPTS